MQKPIKMEMQKWRWVWWLSVCVVLTSIAAATSADPPDSMARPTRPKVFSSPEDLRTYLDQLGNFYAIAGRPRFGKRNLEPWMANYLGENRDNTMPWFRQQRFPISNTDVLQMLSSANQAKE